MSANEKTRIYRLVEPSRWAEAMHAGVFKGEADDVRDGFIHFSTAEQLEGTLDKHYGAYDRLALVEVVAGDVGAELKWEKSRGGDLFPHLYGALAMTAVTSLRLIRRNDDNSWTLPDEIFQ
tara:strand:+ start:72 stop:434 length:363 start_codon:yes stop_codon:yes gene_type:complete